MKASVHAGSSVRNPSQAAFPLPQRLHLVDGRRRGRRRGSFGAAPAAFASSRRIGAPRLHEWSAIAVAHLMTNRISSRLARVRPPFASGHRFSTGSSTPSCKQRPMRGPTVRALRGLGPKDRSRGRALARHSLWIPPLASFNPYAWRLSGKGQTLVLSTSPRLISSGQRSNSTLITPARTFAFRAAWSLSAWSA
jgi:hypothetical protein